MDTIQIKDKMFTVSIKEQDILKEVTRVANEINRDLAGKNPLFLSVLNGSFMFTSDLMKRITIPCEISFVKLASYQGVSSTGSDRHQRRHLRTHHCHCRRYRRYRPHHATPAGIPWHTWPQGNSHCLVTGETRQVESRLEHRIRSHEHSQRLHRGLWSGL